MDERIEVTKEEFKKFNEACRNAETPNKSLKEALKEVSQNHKQFEIGENVVCVADGHECFVTNNVPDSDGDIVVLRKDGRYMINPLSYFYRKEEPIKEVVRDQRQFEIGEVVYNTLGEKEVILSNVLDEEGTIVTKDEKGELRFANIDRLFKHKKKKPIKKLFFDKRISSIENIKQMVGKLNEVIKVVNELNKKA